MSLSKQLLILISALFILIFSVNFILSINNIKGYLEGEAKNHAQDTATSLGLSLSPYMADETDPIIKTTMSAIFDSGFYQAITLENVEKKILIKLSNENAPTDVPEWFIKIFPLKVATAQNEISSGWNISGIIFVTINPGYAYRKLYQQVKISFLYSLVALLLSLIILFFLLRITLSPLKKIDQLALTIAEGKFDSITPLPWTTEVRHVTQSINLLSGKMRALINNLNTRLNSMKQKLMQDELTGLKNKSSFEADIKALFSAETPAYLFLIKIDALSNLIKERGNNSIDQFLKEVASNLKYLANQKAKINVSVYRFLGSEFMLLIKDADKERIEQLARQLSDLFTQLGEKQHHPDIAHFGIVPLTPPQNQEQILLAANEAYEQACLIGSNSFHIRSHENQAIDIAEWKSLVFDMVDNQKYKISFIDPIKDLKTGELLMEEAFTQAFDRQNNPVSTATFISIAEKFEKIIELDKGMILKTIAYIKNSNASHSIAINLSTRTIKNSAFHSWLVALLRQNQSLSKQLVFTLSAYAVAKEVSIYRAFINQIHHHQAKIMIKRFESHYLSPDRSKKLKPDFIRLTRDIGNGIAMNEKKQLFVQTLQDICELLDITILAENVHSTDDYNYLKSVAITGASQ